jgi:hypothetical protein
VSEKAGELEVKGILPEGVIRDTFKHYIGLSMPGISIYQGPPAPSRPYLKMTPKLLIERLSKLDPDAEIEIYGDYDGEAEVVLVDDRTTTIWSNTERVQGDSSGDDEGRAEEDAGDGRISGE